MSGKRHVRRGPDGRFLAAAAKPASEADGPGMELKRARGDRAGGRPQIRRKHSGALTKSEIETFLATLAETCNLAHSARTAGRSTDKIFRDHRKRDPAFAAAWDGTVRDSYDMLELEMNRRMRFGTPKEVFHQGRKVARIRVFNDGLALRLLSLHRKSVERMRAAESAPRRDVRTLIDEIAARMAEIRAEQAARKAGETNDGGQ
jgi:hypothetical protein